MNIYVLKRRVSKKIFINLYICRICCPFFFFTNQLIKWWFYSNRNIFTWIWIITQHYTYTWVALSANNADFCQNKSDTKENSIDRFISYESFYLDFYICQALSNKIEIEVGRHLGETSKRIRVKDVMHLHSV